jgi:hypothetical protein
VESVLWVEEMLNIAKTIGDADLLVTGHGLACTCYSFAGDTRAIALRNQNNASRVLR